MTDTLMSVSNITKKNLIHTEQAIMTKIKFFFSLLMMLFSLAVLAAGTSSPWGGSMVTATTYKPQKVVYDVNVKTTKDLESVLNRASYISIISGADPFEQSIVLVLHGPEINFFGIKNFAKHKELMKRAQSLVESEVLTIKMCKIAAEGRGFNPKDIHGFVEMVPMGDAEIVRLQNEENHAYMQ